MENGLFNNPKVYKDKNGKFKVRSTPSKDSMDERGQFQMGTSYGVGHVNPSGSKR